MLIVYEYNQLQCMNYIDKIITQGGLLILHIMNILDDGDEVVM